MTEIVGVYDPEDAPQQLVEFWDLDEVTRAGVTLVAAELLSTMMHNDEIPHGELYEEKLLIKLDDGRLTISDYAVFLGEK
jgi:hypothetical protein